MIKKRQRQALYTLHKYVDLYKIPKKPLITDHIFCYVYSIIMLQ